jgi:ATP-dependent DNA ligase
VIAALAKLKARQFVLDGEIVVPMGDRLSFDELLLRIHPAESRIKKLSSEHPALFIAFDLLADARGKSLLDAPLERRRERLEAFAKKYFPPEINVRLSPASTDLRRAKQWFRSAGGSLDGIIAKRIDLPYQAGERTGMHKIKPVQTIDCVVGGFRYGTRTKIVGPLLLGLYDGEGLLNHVGFTSSLKASDREKITLKLEKLIKPPGFTGRAPGGPSRWSTERSTQWQPLQPKLVVEVEFDHFTGGRFRHGARFVRWRPDKSPQQCTMVQVAKDGGASLKLLQT